MTKALERIKARLDAMIEAESVSIKFSVHNQSSFSRGYRLGLDHAKDMIVREIEDAKVLEDKP